MAVRATVAPGHGGLFFITMFCLLGVAATSIRWWNMGNMHSPVTYTNFVTHSGMHNAMNSRQMKVIAEYPDSVQAVVWSLDLAKEECIHQMRYHRWNCDSSSDRNFMGLITSFAFKETAFALALVAAGLTHAVAKSCYSGEIRACACVDRFANNATFVPLPNETNQFSYEGCGHNVGFSMKFAEKILDELDGPNDPRSKFFLHNSKVGRDTVQSTMTVECKCIGVSGACPARACYHTLAPFRSVGDILYRKYSTATRVPVDGQTLGSNLKHKDLVSPVRRAVAQHEEVQSGDLVYFEESPDFCDLDPRTETSGTRNRRCDPQSARNDGCAHLCCGRGHVESRGSIAERCECKFVWCCLTICENCNNSFVKHTCL